MIKGDTRSIGHFCIFRAVKGLGLVDFPTVLLDSKP